MNSFLGTDLRVDGKLDEWGQIPTITGVDNVEQALIKRLNMVRGSYWFISPKMGSRLHEYLGMPNTYATQHLIALEIELTCLQDRRVRKANVNIIRKKKDPNEQNYLNDDETPDVFYRAEVLLHDDQVIVLTVNEDDDMTIVEEN